MDEADVVSNKLATLAFAVVDAIGADTEELSPSAMAALISLKVRGPMAIGDVAGIVGLTHSAAVRLVDRLEKDWLVRRQRRVGREVMVELTSRGKRRAGTLQEKRLQAARSFLAHIPGDQREAFLAMIDQMLETKVEAGIDPLRICRMCTGVACVICSVERPVMVAE
ncbi:MarR family winged helix-turn-helix transcriptional regulator [Methylobrevis albus]|uniref:MarR family transcriptional regulator n=1 Tax=Methylobrevis albus TaxID=2793297 RepID=A0A931I2B5_9HYPH|nr:MarR family transcriptional regulator [Methylobrevis albus]MBH0238527.1 MarR family transcriptional regulator [Methylobrevis albus]